MPLPQKIQAVGENPDKFVHLLVPPGIGDISWIYSKIHALGEQLRRQVILSPVDNGPRRSEAFIRLLPNVHWGGTYREGWGPSVVWQSVPAEWNFEVYGWTPFKQSNGYPMYIAANLHLEAGRRITEWLPQLPVDYHYPLDLSPPDTIRAKQVVAGAEKIVMVYVANRWLHKSDSWHLWSDQQWIDFLSGINDTPGCENTTFLFVGAAWDKDRTGDIGEGLAKRGAKVRYMLGEPLGAVVAAMLACDYFVAFPSGIGIITNVVQLPGIMLLPKWLAGLQYSYADPRDLATKSYHPMIDPTPEEALKFFREKGIEHFGKTPWKG